MMKDHKVTRPYPENAIFAKNPGMDRYVCASPSFEELAAWFGKYLDEYMKEGGYIAVYEIPESSIAEQDGQQIVYQQRQARCISREGQPVDASKLVEKFHPDKVL